MLKSSIDWMKTRRRALTIPGIERGSVTVRNILAFGGPEIEGGVLYGGIQLFKYSRERKIGYGKKTIWIEQ